MELKNKLQCKLCGDIIESKHVHDFKFCRCNAIYVDGGKDYIRWGGDRKNQIMFDINDNIVLSDSIEEVEHKSEDIKPLNIKQKGIRQLKIDHIDVKGEINAFKMVFGPHFYMNYSIENKIPYLEIGATHHGIKFRIDEINGEFEKAIDYLREKFKNNITD